MAQKHVFFSCDDLRLEGVLLIPEGSGPFPGVVLCHPHPLYGGDMGNSVVMALVRALDQAGIATLRFNFRGVGESSGEFADGIGEQEDAQAAIGYLASIAEIDSELIGIAGYSFGSVIAMAAAASDERAKCVAAISPTQSMGTFKNIMSCPKPKFITIGQNDDFTPAQRIARLVELMPEPKSLDIVPNVDHFWMGYESLFAPKVTEFFSSCLGEEKKD